MKKVHGKWQQCNVRVQRILCQRTCSKRCDKSKTLSCSKITEEDRQKDFDKFWGSMNWEDRMVYVNGLVGSTDKISKNKWKLKKAKILQVVLMEGK